MANKITIQFEAKGAEKLRAEINKLSKAHNGLSGAHKKVTKSGKKVSGGMMDITNKGRLLQNSFATTRSKLLLVSFAVVLIQRSFGRLIQAYNKQEQADKKLQAVITSTASVAKLTASELKGMAFVLQ